METYVQSIVHLIVALYAFFLFGDGYRRRREIPRFNYVSLVNAGIGGWNFLLFLYYGLITPDAVYIMSQWGFVSVNVTIFGLFFFSWRLIHAHRLDRVLLLFAVIPVASCILSITSPFHSLFLTGHGGFEFLPLRELKFSHGPWFIVHSVYCYFLIFVTLGLLFYQYIKKRRKNRLPLLLFVLSALIFSIFLFFSNFTSLKGSIQPYAFIGHLVCASIFYWASYLDDDETVIYYGKYRFYDTVGIPVLMFNNGGELLYINNEAELYLKSCGISFDPYLDYVSFFDGSLFYVIDNPSPSNKEQSFFAKNTRSGRVIYFRKAEIHSGKGKVIGFSLTLYDLSSMDSFVKNLESRAYTDTLCRCLNRSCYEERKARILNAADRPLGIFIADIDNLKSVNDKWGHAAGDDYIKTCAEIMKTFVSSTDNLYRIGGDEFIFFIPNLVPGGAERIKKGIEAEISTLKKNYHCGLSIGHSVLQEGDADFDRHFNIADEDMYRQKKSKK